MLARTQSAHFIEGIAFALYILCLAIANVFSATTILERYADQSSDAHIPLSGVLVGVDLSRLVSAYEAVRMRLASQSQPPAA